MTLDLLRLRNEASFDARGRVADLYGVIIAVAGDGRALWIGAEVPERAADELAAAFARSKVSLDAGAPPDGASLCYLIEEPARVQASARIERSNAADVDGLHGANPGGWHPVEWDELLDGTLGPWTMALEDARVVSICHTPRPPSARVAECGVWTDPQYRGRGYAAAVTAEWAALVRPSGRRLFYSTDAHNRSSQAVARRLGLRPLGWTWRLGHARAEDATQIHPLSSLRRVP